MWPRALGYTVSVYQGCEKRYCSLASSKPLALQINPVAILAEHLPRAVLPANAVTLRLPFPPTAGTPRHATHTKSSITNSKLAPRPPPDRTPLDRTHTARERGHAGGPIRSW